MKVAILNNDNSFSHTEEAQLVKTFDVDGKTLIDTYSIGGIFVDILPKIDYNPEIEKLVFNFEDNQWIKQDIEISGDFYLKTDGSHHISITKKQSDLYTEIAPVINDGDSVIFNEDNQTWEYAIKGSVTLAQELEHKNELLISAKNIRKQYITDKRSNLTDKGVVEYKSNTYSNAQSAKTAILNYIVSLNDINKGGYLTYPEQKFAQLSKVEFQELALLIQKNELSLRQRQSVALQAIESATTIEEINSIEL